MNKLIYQQSNILLSTGDSFVETTSFNIPSNSGGILIAKLSSIGAGGTTSLPDHGYVSEMVCRFQKNDSGVLSLGTTSILFLSANVGFTPTPSFVINSNNIRVRFTLNGSAYDTYWMVDLEVFYVNI